VRALASKRGSLGSARNWARNRNPYVTHFPSWISKQSTLPSRDSWGCALTISYRFSGRFTCKKEPGATPEHHEFLATDTNDPRREFITSLCSVLGKSGSIVVYYQPFEEQRLSDLAAWLPEFAGRIKKIQRRFWDLLPAIRNHVYHPAFAGSYSLKDVLPALIPAMTYQNMAVANGQAAGLAWESLVRGTVDGVERDRIRKALLDYCGQDTLALLMLLNTLRLSSH
jgi:hypothetical protein